MDDEEVHPVNLALEAFFIVAGAGAGAVFRYVIGGWVGHLAGPGFPWGTLAVNLLGCFALGVLVGAAPEERTLLFVVSGGVIGGFTTFSTLMFETVNLSLAKEHHRASMNVAANLVLGFAALFIGTYLGAAFS